VLAFNCFRGGNLRREYGGISKMTTKASKNFLLMNFVILAISVAGASAANAEEISTSETTVGYARQTLNRVLGAEYALVPGSIQISLRQSTIVDIGGAVRAVFGKEKSEYQVDFRVMDPAQKVFQGRTYMTIEAANASDVSSDQDNNTTLRGVDAGTGRQIKVQLFEYQNYPQAITVKSLELKKFGK
jgi:hypothetical protein